MTARAASPLRATAAVAGTEIRLALRRGETLLATAILPVVVLVFFASSTVIAVPGRAVDFLLPGSIAFGIIATSLVSLGITTEYDRHYGVLKRLGGTPLTRTELVAAKLVVVALVEAVQVVVLVSVALLFLGWQPAAGSSIMGVVAAVGLGTLAHAGLGLLLAGTLRAEAVLAVANGLFVAALVVGGVVVPLDHLPAGLSAIAPWLPFGALSEALRAALEGSGSATQPLLVLTAWGVATTGAAARMFRWD
jgi:ABC-2 type transport system permease protein